MEKRSRRETIAAVAAAAVLTAGGAWFSAGFYRSAPREINSAEIVHRKPALPDITAEGGGQTEKASSGNDSREENSSPENSLPTTAVGEDSSHEKASYPSPGESSPAEETETQQQPVSRSEPVITQSPPSADAPALTIGDGSKTDREYFTTSIKNGERVGDSLYFFTVTHLIDSLELLRCDVQVNGKAQEGFAGRCRLTEGANTIRVSCSYRDKENKIYRAFRDYTVYLESERAAINTDLTDRVVYQPRLSFTAECEDGLEVRLNGGAVAGGGSYTVTLAEGENLITLTSGKQELVFTVTYIPLRELDIITDLADCTVYGEELVFTAQAVGGSSPTLTVQVNGKAVHGKEGVYTVPLTEGQNSIRLLAKDGADRAEKLFTVTALPEYDEKKLPRLESISLTDNMTVRGGSYMLSLKAEDCDGVRIYSDNIEVFCGGEQLQRRWEDASGTGYMLELRSGENSVYIRLTDDTGRQSEFFYRINCEGAAVGEEIGRVDISVRADLLGLGVLCEEDSFPLLEGETGFDTIERFLREKGFEVTGSSGYLERISMPNRFAAAAPTEEELAYLENAGIRVNNSGDPHSLGEFDYTTSSGWIFFVGGEKVSYGISSAVFAEGERIELRFSLDLGNDVRSVEE